MYNEHETMCADIPGNEAEEIRTRHGNYMGSLRLRGHTFWARWHYKGQSYERSSCATSSLEERMRDDAVSRASPSFPRRESSLLPQKMDDSSFLTPSSITNASP